MDGIEYHEGQAKLLRETRRKHEEWMKGVDALKEQAAREAEEKRAADAASRAEAADKRFVADLRRRYLASDPRATEADFQRDLPELRKQRRIAAVAGASTEDDKARARFVRQYQG
ncbi:MAG: hypothetical protein M3Q71_22145 [Chloroflexota bacterium]|nr:hypothetical protein [Chloroflexota bacterium]